MADSDDYDASKVFLAAVCGIGGVSVIALAVALFVGSSDPKQPADHTPFQNDELAQHAERKREDRAGSGAIRKPLDGDVRIDISVTQDERRRVRIHGATNLPPGTDLMLSIAERLRGGFFGQSRCSVLDDRSFQSEPFGPAGGLDDGVYVASVTMPFTYLQPDHVQQVIGENGENLSGPLVQVGISGATVSADREFTVGGADASQRQKERANARVRQYRVWLNKVVAINSRVQTARSSNLLQDDRNTANLAKWGAFARQFTEDYQSHMDQLMEVEPMYARSMIVGPLDDIHRMFWATAFQNLRDYNVARAQYTEDLKELEKFVADAEAKP